MLINGVSLSAFNAQLHDRVMTSNNVETTQEWLEGDIQPTFIRQQDKFKKIKLEFLITETNEEVAFLTMSRLTQELRKATLMFEDIQLLFDVTMDGEAQQRRLKNGNFILTVNLLSDYARGQGEVYTTDSIATSYFYLNVLYYMQGNIMLGSDKVLIRASQFTGQDTFESLGVDLNKYLPEHYNPGIVTNFAGLELNYENLYQMQTILVNYAPVIYTKEVEYFTGEANNGILTPIQTVLITYTKEQIDKATNIGQIIDLKSNKPIGYRASTNYNVDFNFENFLNFSRIEVYFIRIQNELTKDIAITYQLENDDGAFFDYQTQIVNVRESDIVNGTRLQDIININAYLPEKYYENGTCVEIDMSQPISFEELAATYTIRYRLAENIILTEYFLGTYPNWSRITTFTYKIKYKTSFDTAPDIITALGIDLNRYKTEPYNEGKLHNANLITDFDSILSMGVLQIYYEPKDYTIKVAYFQEEQNLGYKDFVINDLMFLGSPVLSEIINVNEMKPEGYIFDANLSYNGEVSLSALTAASPIIITYVPVQEIRTKSIIIKYKQELSSAFSTINTSVITIEESDVGGGIKLSDLINLDAYRPEYYNNGIIDGASSSGIVLFDEIQGVYNVLYMATPYSTSVRYYTDEIDNYNWIGSDAIHYKIIDFTTSTTLTDLGLNINSFKPPYCADGEVQYTGPVTFSALINLEAINIVYTTVEEPEDPDGINYPHRILFLQHNDMGNYESQYPAWTLNHAYINTGVTVDDMSKLTVLCDTYRVFETEPLHNVNVEDAYLFGSVTPRGSYYIKFVNNTKFKQESLLTGVNTFNVAAGYGTPELIVEETSSEGFSKNTGITASSRDGYSYATLTYTNLVQSNNAPLSVPLYLFACNYNGYYKGGIAGVGIKSCKIYYDDVLIRDFIPVAFYDQIGDKVAPSNCLYDKVSQSFFEDARGLDSFNIMDDPDYTDTDPSHQIGCCYVSYYQGDTLFNTSTIWFRGSDFIDNGFILKDKFFVDYYQPQYYGTGYIENEPPQGDVTFNNIKNQHFKVIYPSVGYNIVVNYYKDEKSQENLLGTEVISLTDKTFLSVPTFGDIVPIQKYKPDEYKAIYTYPDTKVTLSRMLEHAPYDIVYVKVDDPAIYETKITYLRKRFGIDILNPEQTYENLGSISLQLDETQFADGVYIDDFIDWNAKRPVNTFYTSGAPFEWYLKDERLTTPEDLKSEYKISYEPVPQFININYYTDVVEEENLIASATWSIQIDEWPDGDQFSLVDELPNHYIDKYKPVICGGGRLENPEFMWTFETLVAAGEINIIYDTLEEPHDPESTMWPSKVLWWTKGYMRDGHLSDWQHTHPITALDGASDFDPVNITTPYIDLGYTPKEIGRLRVETKAYALNCGLKNLTVNSYGISSDSYSYFLGYYGALAAEEVDRIVGTTSSAAATILQGAFGNSSTSEYTQWSPNSSGWFAIKGHTPWAGTLSYHSRAPQSFDGWPAWNNSTANFNEGFNRETVREMTGGWRRGYYVTPGNNWEDIVTFENYIINIAEGFGSAIESPPINPPGGTFGDRNINQRLTSRWAPERGPFPTPSKASDFIGLDPKYDPTYPWGMVANNPLTITLDAYNNYIELYDYRNSNNPYYVNVKNVDQDIFTRRTQPKGSLTLFITTNPDTGKLNWLFQSEGLHTYLGFQASWMPGSLVSATMGNPWSETFDPSITITQQVITGTTPEGTPIYEEKQTTHTLNYARYMPPIFDVPHRAAVWYLKIWDRDKLVRDMIPVAQGDKIYDYIAPGNGLFDKVTEIFFMNQNQGGDYTYPDWHGSTFLGYKNIVVKPEDVLPLHVDPDPTVYGNIVVNYYDDKNNFLGNQYVEIPVHYMENNETIYEICHYNDFKPNDFYHDGMIDIDLDLTKPTDATLKSIYEAGSINVFYKLITFTKTVVYYHDNVRVGSKDLFYSLEDIDKAETLADLGIDIDLYASENFAPGRVVFNEQVIADDDIKTFIDASSPIVVYDKLTKEEAPDLLYVEYYREGAYDDTLITLDENDPNYLNCDLNAVVLNPSGAIKYLNHYHSALYEDEKQDYFIAYQVDVKANYVPVHKGPARRYNTLAVIVDKGRYTVVEERNGWGRLKEYPKGWIMLSYTEPVTGPGQNPDYDDVNQAQVTIPFGTRITINRLTIDRLWAYSPEYASWIKTEEISYDQSGKLYNGLAIKVINLNEIDWSIANSFENMGINPNAYMLKYHDAARYQEPTEYTQEYFSNAHNIDFVYPETIYAYNCIYYADIKQPEHELGRVSFSCSMSDWNPDWDTFIATSWQVTEDGDPINPTLYRDTELTLTWDYFGIDKNLYKPEIGNYNDGIWVWNPRTYENSDIYFTFEELVTTGYQEILYLPTYNAYKAKYHVGRTTLPVNIVDFDCAPKVGTGLWDIEFKNQKLTGPSKELLYESYNSMAGTYYRVGARNWTFSTSSIAYQSDYDSGLNSDGGMPSWRYRSRRYTPAGSASYGQTYFTLAGVTFTPTESFYTINNWSNKRNASLITSYGNDLTNWHSDTYIRYQTDTGYQNQKISRTLDMRDEKYYRWGAADTNQKYFEGILTPDPDYEYYNLNNNSYPKFTIGSGSQKISEVSAPGSQYNGYHALHDTIWYYIKVWKNYYLEHYYIPLPKGAWLADGRQIPYNTFYDVITNTICENLEEPAYPIVTAPYIYKLGAEPVGDSVDYFEYWSYNYTDCTLTARTTEDIIGYKDPDVLSIQLTNYPQGMVMPVRRYTADAENRVIGEWYFNGYAWVQSDKLELLASDEYIITDLKDSAAVKGDRRNTATKYNGYLTPKAQTGSEKTSFTAETVITLYGECGDFYWSGINWIPKTYTSKTTVAETDPYVVAIDYLNMYKYPIANDLYKVVRLQSGDRIQTESHLYKDEHWKYITVNGVKGWIDGYNTITPIL